MASATLTPASVAAVSGGSSAWTNPANALTANSTYATTPTAATINLVSDKLRYDIAAALLANPLILTGKVRHVAFNFRRARVSGTADTAKAIGALVINSDNPTELTAVNGIAWTGGGGAPWTGNLNVDDLSTPWLPAGLENPANLASLFAVDIWAKNASATPQAQTLGADHLTLTIDHEPGPTAAGGSIERAPTTVVVASQTGATVTNDQTLVGVKTGATTQIDTTGANPSTIIKCTFDPSEIPAGSTMVEVRVTLKGYSASVLTSHGYGFTTLPSLTATCKANSVDSPESWSNKYRPTDTGLAFTQALNGYDRTFSWSGANCPTRAELIANGQIWFTFANAPLDSAGNGSGSYDTMRELITAAVVEYRYNPPAAPRVRATTVGGTLGIL